MSVVVFGLPGENAKNQCQAPPIDIQSLQTIISSTKKGADNPVNVITGNKYQREEDMPALPGVLGLEVANKEEPLLENGKPNPSHTARQREIERNMAIRVARLHNSGIRSSVAVDPNLGELLTQDSGKYVKKFLGVHGHWPSLRCGTSVAGSYDQWRGIQLTPLEIK